MSLTLLGEESPQFVCLEHPESCILSIKNFLFFSSSYIAIFYLNAVFSALAFLRFHICFQRRVI